MPSTPPISQAPIPPALIPPALAQRHYSLDYIRALCILYLMGFWHLFEYTGIPRAIYNNDITRRGATIDLALFCLISGFLCARKPIVGAKGLRGYYVGRFWRLYPPFLAAGLLFIFMHVDEPKPVIHALALISMFTHVAPRTLWFIDMLVMFYAAAPLFLWARDKVWMCLLTLGIVLGACYAYDQTTHLLDRRLMLFLPCFVAGILFAGKTPKLTWTLGALLVVLWGLSAWLTVLIPYEQLKDSLLQVPLGVVSAVLLFLLIYRFADQLKPPAVVLWVSYASYFMYLFHRPLYTIVTPWLGGLSTPVRTTVLVAAIVPLLIVIAYLLQKGYDWLISRFVLRAKEA